MNKEKLIEILSIPSYSGKEEIISEYIIRTLNDMGVDNYQDKYGNIYATKGNVEYFPCVVSHIDTVHEIENINIKDNGGILSGFNDVNEKTGIGGDNKAGVFVCLELLKKVVNIKAAFFVSEEVGCLGSYLSDPKFFQNVGYAIQFDAPFNNWVSHYSDGVKLFEVDSEFFNKINHVFQSNLPGYSVKDLGNHPYTDVSALKTLYNFACVNYSVGYYNMHTKDEYVSLNDVNLCLNTAIELIQSLGNELYYLPTDVILNESARKELEKRLFKYKSSKLL